MPGDLHTHSTFSDGSVPAARLPALARAAGLSAIAISDHDSIQSVRFAHAHPELDGVRLLPAAELSAWDNVRKRRVHILCYCPDDCEALQSFTALMAKRRLKSGLQSCAQLEKRFAQFTTADALELAADSGTMYKAHIMRLLWERGLADGMYSETYHQIFTTRPEPGKIMHVTRYESVETVLGVIRASRGVAVLAHPSVYRSMELARELIPAGLLDGVEIDHPRNTPEDRAELLELAQKHDLIVTGGSDFHGLHTKVPRPVGAGITADDQIDRIFALAKARKQ